MCTSVIHCAAALLFQMPACLSAKNFAPLMRMPETCTHSAFRCICVRIGYLLVLVPYTKCVCVCMYTQKSG